MTIKEINKRRKRGDITRVSELSGIPLRTVQDILFGKRSSETKRGREVVKWFTNYLNCLDKITGE